MSDRRIEFLERLGALLGEFGTDIDIEMKSVDYMGDYIESLDFTLNYQAEVDGQLGNQSHLISIKTNGNVTESDIYDKIKEISAGKVDNY